MKSKIESNTYLKIKLFVFVLFFLLSMVYKTEFYLAVWAAVFIEIMLSKETFVNKVEEAYGECLFQLNNEPFYTSYPTIKEQRERFYKLIKLIDILLICFLYLISIASFIVFKQIEKELLSHLVLLAFSFLFLFLALFIPPYESTFFKIKLKYFR
jgi:hypothetical protein